MCYWVEQNKPVLVSCDKNNDSSIKIFNKSSVYSKNQPSMKFISIPSMHKKEDVQKYISIGINFAINLLKGSLFSQIGLFS